MRPCYQRLLIAVLVLAVYMPTIAAGLCNVDDTGIVSLLLNDNKIGLKQIFFPQDAVGHYYRPMIMASYLADRFFWFADERFMHLENIIIHLCSTLLVYQLARFLTRESENNSPYVALVAALAFGLHPVNTEAVSWICGRSDLLAGLFVLATVLLILYSRIKSGRIYSLLAIVTFICGVLSKEVTLALLPGILLLLKSDKPAMSESHRERGIWRLLPALAMVALAIAGVLVWSQFSGLHTGSALGDTLTYARINPVHTLFIAFRAFGYYISKILLPFPLNFTTYEVDPLYELLAFPLLLLSGLICFRRSLLSALFISGLLFLLPAFLIALNRIAWTAYAERYVYIPSAFIICAAVIYFDARFRSADRPRLAVSLAALMVVLWSAAVLQRSFVWRDSRELLKDSVEKNPSFYMVRNNYGELLMRNGELAKARVQFEKSNAIHPNEQARLNLGEVLYLEGKSDEAVTFLRTILAESNGTSIKAYDHLIAILEKQLIASRDAASARNLLSLLREYRLKRENASSDPYSLYRIGQLSLALGEKKVALYYFRMADSRFAAGDVYKSFCRKLIARLEA